MKKSYFVFAFLMVGITLIGTGCGKPVQNPPISCPAGQYACACATGNYCLKMGAMCLSPSSPCPVQ